MKIFGFVAFGIFLNFTTAAFAEDIKVTGQIVHQECLSTIKEALPLLTEGADRKSVNIKEVGAMQEDGNFEVQITALNYGGGLYTLITKSYTYEAGGNKKGCTIKAVKYPSSDKYIAY